jgi:hypothetical protein
MVEVRKRGTGGPWKKHRTRQQLVFTYFRWRNSGWWGFALDGWEIKAKGRDLQGPDRNTRPAAAGLRFGDNVG